MNAAEYRAAAERLIQKNPFALGDPIPEEALRRAEILAQLAVSAAISERTREDLAD